MYTTLSVVLSITYLGHYMAHGYDWLELVCLTVALVVILTLAYKEWRANK